MDATTLAEAMGCSQATAGRYVDAMNLAMAQAGCTTVNRAAMWNAQLGHESQGLFYMQEIWGPTDAQRRYEGRADLGNTRPGDGSRFRGHGPIQITGRHNHTLVSRWAHSKGYVPTPTYFVDHPEELAGERYGFLGAVWYWTVARPQINSMCDAGDLEGVTRAINGGTNGLDDREDRWDHCRALGAALLPDTEEDELTPEEKQRLGRLEQKVDLLLSQLVVGEGNIQDPGTWGWPGWGGGTGETLTPVDYWRRSNVETRQAIVRVDAARKVTADGMAALARQLGELTAKVDGGGLAVVSHGPGIQFPAEFTFTGTATPRT